MNAFGLGVILQVTDNMSVGFANAMGTLTQFESQMNKVANATSLGMTQIESEMLRIQSITTLGLGMQTLGNQVTNTGKAILSPFIELGKQVTSTGAQFENYRLTLKALYGDVETATLKTNEAMDLAAKTPFQLGDVMDSVIGFKAIGVEALDTMEHLTGESRTLLEYIGDLASLRPDIGLEGMLYGIRNLLGGDGGRSLRSRLDMDFEQMLGFEWADTTEGMIEQIVYASQQVANGLMKEMEGSWGHMTSNIEDQWDKFKLSVADAGAFDGVKNTLRYFYNIVDSIDDEKMARLGQNISSAFNMLWKPIDLVARGLSNFFNMIVNIVSESPMLTKVLTFFTALSGTVLILVGTMTVLGGSVLLAYAGFKGLSLLFTKLPAMIITMIPKLLTVASTLGKFALIGGALYLAWKSDFMGIRTVLQNFMNNVSTAFKESARISQLGVTDMISELNKLDKTSFGGWLTYRLTQIRVFWMALVDAWNDYTLSDDNFQKVQALGLLPLLETILDLKMKAEAFFSGFKKGWNDIKEEAIPIIERICDIVGGIWNALFPINDEVETFNENSKNLELDQWETLGENVAYFVTGLAGILLIGKVVGVITKVASAIWGVITFLGSIVSIIGGAVTAILGFFGVIISAPAWVVGAVTLAVAGALALLWKYKDEVVEVAGNVLGTVVSLFAGIVAGVVVAFMSVGVALITFFEIVVGSIATILGGLVGIVATIGIGIVGAFFSALEIVKGLFQTAIEVIKIIISPLVGFVASIMTAIQGVIDTVLTVIKGIFESVSAVVKAIWTGDFTSLGETLKSIWGGVGERIKEIWNNTTTRIQEIWKGVQTFLSQSFENIKGIWSTTMDNISTIADNCVTSIKGVWSGIGSFFSGLWQGIMNSASSMFNWLASKFSWVSNSINTVKGWFNWGGNDIKLEANLPTPKVGLATGGFVKDEGVAMLHPNEVVINDDLTRKLRNFLDEENDPTPKPNAPVSRAGSLSSHLINNNNTSQQVSNDYSVTFDKGAIQITVEKGNDAEIEQIAQKIMQKIKRQQQLERTRNYQPSF